MKFYKDKELKEEVESLELGIVDAGSSKEFTYYVHNNTNAILQNLIFNIEKIDEEDEFIEDELLILSSPKDMEPNGIGEFIFKWEPSLEIKKGLHANIHCTGDEIYV